MDVAVVHPAARSALADTALRTANVLRSIEDGTRRVRGLEWTVGELGAHLLVALSAFTESAAGSTDLVDAHLPAGGHYRERLTQVTSSTLDLVPERSPPALAELLPEAVDAFLRATASSAAHQRVATPWYAPGASMSLAAATCLLFGEQLIHGRDLALTGGFPWPISRPEAALLANVFEVMLPLAVNAAAAARVQATFEIRVRSGQRIFVRMDRGRVEVDDRSSGRVDCHLSADPVSLVLVGYGRISQWPPILTGRLVAWGRRPWLALGFRGLFFDP